MYCQTPTVYGKILKFQFWSHKIYLSNFGPIRLESFNFGPNFVQFWSHKILLRQFRRNMREWVSLAVKARQVFQFWSHTIFLNQFCPILVPYDFHLSIFPYLWTFWREKVISHYYDLIFCGNPNIIKLGTTIYLVP